MGIAVGFVALLMALFGICLGYSNVFRDSTLPAFWDQAIALRIEMLYDYFDGRFTDWNVKIVDTGGDADTGDRIFRCGATSRRFANGYTAFPMTLTSEKSALNDSRSFSRPLICTWRTRSLEIFKSFPMSLSFLVDPPEVNPNLWLNTCFSR